MKKMTWSIGRKLTVGFAAVILLTIAVGATGLFALNRVNSEVETTTTVSARLETLSNLINISLLEARRSETAFLLRYPIIRIAEAKAEYVSRVQAQVAAIHAYADEGISLETGEADRARFRQIKTLIDGHEAAFLQAVALVEQRGHEDTGLEGQFRAKIHQMEEAVAAAGLDQLTIDILSIRRNEKDYLLRGNQEDIDHVTHFVTQFKQHLAATNLSAADQASLVGLADKYLALFQQLTQVDADLDAAIDQYLEQANNIEPLVAEIRTDASEDFRQSVQTADQMLHIANRLEFVTLVLEILLGFGIALLLTRRISRPVVKVRTERKARATALEQRVEERTREFAVLLEVAHNLASTLDMERLLGLILDQLKIVVDCFGATIYKVEEEALIALAHRGPIPQEEISELRFLVQQAGAFQQVILQQTPVIIPDVRDNTPLAHLFRENVGDRLETAFAYVRSWLGVPLMIKEQVIGMLGLHHDQPNYYTSQHAKLAIAFANHTAIAVENARLYEQAQELATLKERQRLAHDLHDAVSQSLFSASLSAEVLPRLWERHPEEGRRCLMELHRLTRSALAEMRTLLLELRPTALAETALGDLLNQLAEAVASRAMLEVTLAVEIYHPLPPEVQVVLYRIAQEALNNVAKHAGATHVEVKLRSVTFPASREEPKSGVELRIGDDGQGFDFDHVPPVSMGLSIMRERAETIGATLTIESQTGRGTQVVVNWPEVPEAIPLVQLPQKVAELT
jgi:two-component system nitrate/nitrite sensor histidine kinase NarX